MGAKKPAKKVAKKPKKKAAKKPKKKKKKKKKAKKLLYPGGKRPKHGMKSKKMKAAGKASALKLKKKGVGLFKVKTLSADLAAVCGKPKMSSVDVTKAVWAYIKKKGLSKGRMISPDPTLKKVFSGGSMFKMPGAIAKHHK